MCEISSIITITLFALTHIVYPFLHPPIHGVPKCML